MFNVQLSWFSDHSFACLEPMSHHCKVEDKVLELKVVLQTGEISSKLCKKVLHTQHVSVMHNITGFAFVSMKMLQDTDCNSWSMCGAVLSLMHPCLVSFISCLIQY